MEGRCQCGKITFELPLPEPLWVHFCHCLECKHQSSSAFGISAIYPYFVLPQSEYLGCWTKYDAEEGDFHHFFCKNCGSRLVHTDGKTESFVKGGCIVGLTKEMLSKAAHIWTKRGVVDIPPAAEQYKEGYPKGYQPWGQISKS